MEISLGSLRAELARPMCPVTHTASQAGAGLYEHRTLTLEAHKLNATAREEHHMSTQHRRGREAAGRGIPWCLSSSGRVLPEAWVLWHLPHSSGPELVTWPGACPVVWGLVACLCLWPHRPCEGTSGPAGILSGFPVKNGVPSPTGLPTEVWTSRIAFVFCQQEAP